MEYDTKMINRDTFDIVQINKQGIYSCNHNVRFKEKRRTIMKKMTKEEYQQKFEDQMERSEYTLEDGEVIVQCHAPYPVYWFVSNKGKLYSAYRKELYLIEPYYCETGKKNKDGKRSGSNWYYEYHMDGEVNNRHVTMHKLIAEHFLQCDINYEDEDTEIHHIKGRKAFTKDQAKECNSVENLQVLPKSIHRKATYMGSHTQDQLDKDSDDRVKKAGCPDIQINLNSEQFMSWLISAMQDSIDRGVSPYAYLITDTDDSENKRVEVRKIGKVGYEEE